MFHKILNIASHTIQLFYPKICAACTEPLVRNENILCTQCRHELPRTHFHKDPENEVARIFWGRILVENATAYFYFQKGGRVQKLMHKLKYKGEKEVGIELGKMIGHDLVNSSFNLIDIVVPVPLHSSRLRKRGYNQSELIAHGIAESMQKPMNPKTLRRCKANPTQTRKSRYDRWTNVEGIFDVKDTSLLEGKHILLIDDIITTGSTLEASATALLKIPGVKISIAVVGKA